MEPIKPAILNNEDEFEEMTPEEFQRTLNIWFKEKGLLQDMKSYLKFQMISVLRNTAVAKNIRKSSSKTFTLAEQALNLVIADYLYKNNCHFSLSLFSTEVNLTHYLPETKLLFHNKNTGDFQANLFNKNDLIHVLELLGISKHSDYFNAILEEYFECQLTTLLSCLICIIQKKILGESKSEEFLKADTDIDDDFMKNLAQILYSSNVPQKTQTQLFNHIKLCYDLKLKTFETQCMKLVDKFKQELCSRDRKIRECEKRKRCVDKKIAKLQNENTVLKNEIDELLKKRVADEKLSKNGNSVGCLLSHCGEECAKVREMCEIYEKEIKMLQDTNRAQKQEIDKLTNDCSDLLEEFKNYKSKINLVNLQIKEHDYQGIPVTANVTKYSDLSLSSNSDTDELLEQARQRLRLLEEESEELDIRISNFVIK